jgi:hypothetical protein
VLEHFDEYTRGAGRLQQPTVKRARDRVADEALAQQFRITFDYIDREAKQPRIHIGPYSIDLARQAMLQISFPTRSGRP